MSATDRETITSALAALLFAATFPQPIGTATTWTTTGRRLKLWGDVPVGSQPACYLVSHDETRVWQGRGLLGKRTLPYKLWCYASTLNPDAVGDQYLNWMLEGVEAALAPDDVPGGVLTLGGQVDWCRIEGTTFRDPGDLDGQALLIVPIVVMWP